MESVVSSVDYSVSVNVSNSFFFWAIVGNYGGPGPKLKLPDMYQLVDFTTKCEM